MSAAQKQTIGRAKPKTTTYYVNGKAFTMDERKLTPRQILANADFSPAEQYRLVRDDGDKTLADFDKNEPIHQGERFTALFNGPTQVS